MAEPVVWIRRGARAVEQALLDEVGAWTRSVRSDPARLAHPLRIVVPSRSLREHLSARVVRRLGGGAAGVALHTLRGFAFEILRRAGEGAPGGDALFPVLVRRHAREEPALREGLEALQDGYGAVTAAVGDLLDAGLEAAHEPALLEWAAARGRGRAEARLAAVLRVAAAVQRSLRERGLEHRSDLFRRAREAVETDAARVPPASALWFHGYADVTGVQLELIAALVRLAGARIWLDRPDDPADPGRPDPGVAYTERLLARLAPLGAAPDAAAPAPPAAARPALLRAPGSQAELRAVAERIRAALDAGTPAEEIGLVARDWAPYRDALPVQLGRLGVPFSGGEGSLGPEGRRVRALLDLLRYGRRATADRWLDAAVLFGRARTRDLRLALHGIGVGRVHQVASLDVAGVVGGSGSFALPVRRGLGPAPGEGDDSLELADEPREARPDDGPEGTPAGAPGATRSVGALAGAEAGAPLRAERRRVSRATLEEAAERARAWLRVVEGWPATAPLGRHAEILRDAVAALRWEDALPGATELARRLDDLLAELGPAVELDRDAFQLLLERAVRELGVRGPGGAGSGVQVLTVTEARARTFARLFVLGMNRDLFPRAIAEDPLLPDRERRALEEMLPDVPVKQRGHTEERYLFAQLCSASAHVTLSWQEVSDDGKERPASPLIERLRLGAAEDEEVPLAPLLLEGPADRVRPAHEHAVHAGLAGDRAALRIALALAHGSPASEAEAVAGARVAVAAELDSTGARLPDLGPYFGFVGPIRPEGDPRDRTPWVTRLESLAVCGWRTFLERLLGLEPVPDALAALPDASPLLVGQVLHRVMERMVARAGAPVGGTLGDVPLEPVAVPWPDAAVLDAELEDCADAVSREEGIVLRGFGRMLARRTRPFLERIRALDAPTGALPGVVGAELEGAVAFEDGAGAPRRLRFRADRVDAAEGGLRLTDYKSGRPVSEAKRPATRRGHLLARIAEGRSLQAVAYARAPGVVSGRYLFARPGLADDAAAPEVAADDPEAGARLERALRTLVEAWERGDVFPRLLQPDLADEPGPCKGCAVASACLRGETGARRRLARWVEARTRAAEGATRPEEARWLALWSLGREPT